MYEGFVVIAVADLAKRMWQHQGPLPTNEQDTPAIAQKRSQMKIHKMLRIGDMVEVFALPSTSPGEPTPDVRGVHETLLPPLVAIVLSCAPETSYMMAISSIPESLERIDQVLDMQGNTWTRGEDVPIDTTMVVDRIEAAQDRIEVFARPKPNSDWAGKQMAFLFTLMSFTVQRITSSAPVQAWGEILRDREEEARLGDDEPDDPDGDLEPEIVPTQAPAVAPAPSPSPLQGLLPSPAVMPPPNGPTPTP